MSKHKLLNERPLINQKVREARKSKGLTQAQAAQKMGMKRDTYQRRESSGNITYAWLLKFCDALDVPRSFFKDVLNDDPTIEEEKSGTLIFKSPLTIKDKLYGEAPEESPNDNLEEENKQTLWVELNYTENGLINTYRTLSKPKQKQARDYINSIR